MNKIGIVEARIGILDPLRFVAALLVMFYHYLPFIQKKIGTNNVNFFEYGYLGVNFFFLLSGFVIMASAQNRSAIKFALLRALRLYPAFIVCLLITLFILHVLDFPLASTTAIFLNGLIINDYFGVPNIDGVYWTLQAELKFYACIFLLILFGQIHHYKLWLSAWLLMAVAHHFTKQPFFMGWFISPSYSFCFIGGISAYLIFNNPKSWYAISIFITAMVFAIIKSCGQIDGFVRAVELWDRVVVGVLTFLFFLFFFFLHNINRYFKYTKLMAVFGGMSYPLYLLHGKAGTSVLGFLSGVLGALESLFVTIILVLATSFFVHYAIEKPLFRAVRHKVN
ncbi:acyltransferase family protein [Cellvibrio fibrivorans]|uniref:Peptidoglycan/LPS O-acetylase OafA/YrhL n=1 Tax=Cellvibrio fibrivorans TaxID=126350 RepID=A0ABU1UU00_9GAMM|nr:acyltransferase [Cellvibrio fibrivorans]MDR7088668.1 peptidoglycan/LPS O-acetylase OafA/YrhL [Cellvibrio fibrivorans]